MDLSQDRLRDDDDDDNDDDDDYDDDTFNVSDSKHHKIRSSSPALLSRSSEIYMFYQTHLRMQRWFATISFRVNSASTTLWVRCEADHVKAGCYNISEVR